MSLLYAAEPNATSPARRPCAASGASNGAAGIDRKTPCCDASLMKTPEKPMKEPD
jgi:hypothetical protein